MGKEHQMHRTLGLGVVVASFVVLLGIGSQIVVAQEATPAASGEGVVKTELGRGRSAVAPDRDLILQQRTFAPGASSGAHPAAGPVVLSVASGEVAFTVVDGAALITRAGATTQENLAAGSEADLYPGDSVFYDEGVVHIVSNEGTTPAVTIEARLNPSDATTTAPSPSASPTP